MKKLIISIGLISIAASAIFVASIDHENQQSKLKATQVVANDVNTINDNDKSYDTRPKGLHGLVWGDSLSKLKNAHLVTDNKNSFNFNGYYLDDDNYPTEQCYVKNHEQLTLGKAHLARIEYCFMNNRFSSFKMFFPVSHPEKNEGRIEYYISDSDDANRHSFEEAISLMYPAPPNQSNVASYLTNIENEIHGYVWDEKIKTDPDATETNKISLKYRDGAFRDYDHDLAYINVSNEGYYHPFSEKIKAKYLEYQQKHIKEQFSQEN
jgi:hypothetical protein